MFSSSSETSQEEQKICAEILEKALLLMRLLFGLSEQRAFVELWVAIKIIETLVKQMELRNPFLNDRHRTLWEDLQISSTSAEERRNPTNTISRTNNSSTPQQDFRTFSLFPTVEELQPDYRPFLRANLTKGRYKSLDEYLDVQFRLFREDLVAPLRNGIRDFLGEYRNRANGAPMTAFRAEQRIADIRVYYDVRVQSSYCEGDGGLLYRIRFSLEGLQRVRWANSKRLMFGSLLCLSSDEFQTVRFAIVYNRDLLEGKQRYDPKSRYNKREGAAASNAAGSRSNKPFDGNSGGLNPNFGYILVRFEDAPNLKPLAEVMDLEVFTMIESGAYFESYRHTMKRLLVFTNADIPRLERYLVDCSTDMQPPAYLKRPMLHVAGDHNFFEAFSSFEEEEGELNDSEPDTPNRHSLTEPPNITGPIINMTTMAVDEASKSALRAISVLEPLETWPSPEIMGIDEAQRAALHAALTQELALIVGPPGTGKTFLGVQAWA